MRFASAGVTWYSLLKTLLPFFRPPDSSSPDFSFLTFDFVSFLVFFAGDFFEEDSSLSLVRFFDSLFTTTAEEEDLLLLFDL